jgi:hypothetical protein
MIPYLLLLATSPLLFQYIVHFLVEAKREMDPMFDKGHHVKTFDAQNNLTYLRCVLIYIFSSLLAFPYFFATLPAAFLASSASRHGTSALSLTGASSKTAR